MSAAVRSICSFVRAAQMTSAPASARARAIWRPRPRPAPVTTATLPSRRKRSRVVMWGVYPQRTQRGGVGGWKMEDGGSGEVGGAKWGVGTWVMLDVRGWMLEEACGRERATFDV